jgi:hypothetical protein
MKGRETVTFLTVSATRPIPPIPAICDANGNDLTLHSALPPLRLRTVLGVLALLALVRGIVFAGYAGARFIDSDSDNLMRLVGLRDWLAGQGWFDMQQYRILPPEGISMHWSRYVDAGIAGLLVPLSWVMPMARAEMLTLVLWPTLLLVALCSVAAAGANRLSGPVAALGAGLLALFWGKLGGGKFMPGGIDHHNVQILFATIALFLALAPARDPGRAAARNGALAGLASAFALAVGLEMLPMLLLLWGFAGLRFACAAPGSRAWLGGFALAIGLGAPLLMAGQTPVADWARPSCDELGLPILALIASGAVASLAGVALATRLAGPLARLALMGGVAALGLWLAAPLLGACLAGPYGTMPAEARQIITDRIIEAQPAARLFPRDPDGVFALLAPLAALIVLAAMLGWQARGQITRAERDALFIALPMAAIGLAFALVQIRAASAGAPAALFLAGFVLARIAALFRQGRPRAGLLAGAAMLLLVFLPNYPMDAARMAQHLLPGEPLLAQTGPPDRRGCLDQDAVAALARLPGDAVILSDLKSGPILLAYTPLAATSAGYHRSGDAYWNGIVPYERESAMIAALHKSRASHVLVCPGKPGRRPFADRLLAGDLPDWLIPLPVQGDARLFRVLPDRLDAAWQTNPPETMDAVWK